MRPVHDVINAFERPSVIKKLNVFLPMDERTGFMLENKVYYEGKNKQSERKTSSFWESRIFNEIHQYEDYKNNVFTTGLGKKKHPRRSYYTTNGDVREGPLDDLLETSEQILRGGEPDNGLLPFICKRKKGRCGSGENWPMANPSLPYLPKVLWKRSGKNIGNGRKIREDFRHL